MLGGSCSPCCACNCATRCAFCFEMSDGTNTWNSCTSAMYDGLPPTRISECLPLTTQPSLSGGAGGTAVVLGSIGAIVSPMRVAQVPPPFQPVSMSDFGNVGFLTGESASDGFVYGKSAGTSAVSGSYLIAQSTEVLAFASVGCAGKSLINPATSGLLLLYRLVISRSEQALVPGLPDKFQRTEIASQAVGQQTFGGFVRSAAGGVSLGGLKSAVIGCTGATHFCNSDGLFAMSNFSMQASPDGISYSINDGLLTDSRGALPVILQECVTQNQDGSNQQPCVDYLSIGNAVFAPPTITGFATNTGDCPSGNPLP